MRPGNPCGTFYKDNSAHDFHWLALHMAALMLHSRGAAGPKRQAEILISSTQGHTHMHKHIAKPEAHPCMSSSPHPHN